MLRFPPVYGPRSRYLGRFLRLVERIGPFGFPFIGDRRNLAPLVYVRDASDAICRAGTAPAAAREILHVKDAVRHSCFDFLSAGAETLGTKPMLVPLSPRLIRFFAGLVDLGAALFSVRADLSDCVGYFSRDIHFENTNARGHLAWKPACTELLPSVREMARSYGEGA